MSNFIVTRPQGQAHDTILSLMSKGHMVLHVPAVEIQPLVFDVPQEGQSLIVTSKNGVRYGLSSIENMSQPVFAVGEKTAKAARELGFTNITVGPGTAKGLIPILLECGITIKRKYVHLCGEDLAYNIVQNLQQNGIEAELVNTYKTVPMNRIDPEVLDAIKAGEVDGVLFYSVRAAVLFEQTLGEMGHIDLMGKMDAYCLSARIKSELIGPWRSRHYSVLPTEKALFSLVK